MTRRLTAGRPGAGYNPAVGNAVFGGAICEYPRGAELTVMVPPAPHAEAPTSS